MHLHNIRKDMFILFKKHAFSLIEILICVAIIIVLASIGIVSYQGSLDSSELKTVAPKVIEYLDGCEDCARYYNLKVNAEFVLGTGVIRIIAGQGSESILITQQDFNKTGILKRKLVFRKYRWQDGAKEPVAFIYFPDANPLGGEVTFGSGFAEARIYLRGSKADFDL